MRSAGRNLGGSVMSSGLPKGLNRMAKTQDSTSRPRRSGVRSTKSGLSCGGQLSAVSEAGDGPTASIVKD